MCKKIIKVLFIVYLVLFSGFVFSQKKELPTPEFFGVYAVADNSLVEVNPISIDYDGSLFDTKNMLRSNFEFDLVKVTCMLSSDKIKFLVYKGEALKIKKIQVTQLARIQSAITYNIMKTEIIERKKLYNRWATLKEVEAVNCRLAPYSKKSQFMIYTVPERKLHNGLWALYFDNDIYVFRVIEGAELSNLCYDRIHRGFDFEYHKCKSIVPKKNLGRELVKKKAYKMPKATISGKCFVPLSLTSRNTIFDEFHKAMINANYKIVYSDKEKGELLSDRFTNDNRFVWKVNIEEHKNINEIQVRMIRGSFSGVIPPDIPSLFKYVFKRLNIDRRKVELGYKGKRKKLNKWIFFQ